jgi:hypothetical protein
MSNLPILSWAPVLQRHYHMYGRIGNLVIVISSSMHYISNRSWDNIAQKHIVELVKLIMHLLITFIADQEGLENGSKPDIDSELFTVQHL